MPWESAEGWWPWCLCVFFSFFWVCYFCFLCGENQRNYMGFFFFFSCFEKQKEMEWWRRLWMVGWIVDGPNGSIKSVRKKYFVKMISNFIY